MPLFLSEIKEDGTRLLVWHLTEDEEDLKMILQDADPSVLSGITHPRRRCQKLVTRILINTLDHLISPNLIYNENGKPALEGENSHLSISHSRNFIGIFWHPEWEAGLDLEEPDGRIQKTAVRFVNHTETEWINATNKEKDYLLIWSVKESVFKAIGGGGIDFKSHLKVNKPEMAENGTGSGLAEYTNPPIMRLFRYHFRYLEDFLLVYTIAEPKTA